MLNSTTTIHYTAYNTALKYTKLYGVTEIVTRKTPVVLKIITKSIMITMHIQTYTFIFLH